MTDFDKAYTEALDLTMERLAMIVVIVDSLYSTITANRLDAAREEWPDFDSRVETLHAELRSVGVIPSASYDRRQQPAGQSALRQATVEKAKSFCASIWSDAVNARVKKLDFYAAAEKDAREFCATHADLRSALLNMYGKSHPLTDQPEAKRIDVAPEPVEHVSRHELECIIVDPVTGRYRVTVLDFNSLYPSVEPFRSENMSCFKLVSRHNEPISLEQVQPLDLEFDHTSTFPSPHRQPLIVKIEATVSNRHVKASIVRGSRDPEQAELDLFREFWRKLELEHVDILSGTESTHRDTSSKPPAPKKAKPPKTKALKQVRATAASFGLQEKKHEWRFNRTK